jgi:hypothetical protein
MTMRDAAQKFFFVSAPRAKSSEPGHVAVLAVSGTQEVLDLSTLGDPAYDGSNANTAQIPGGAINQYITLYADGADVGIIFGAAKADVTGANKPVLATTGTVDGNGVYSPAAGTCFVVKSGTYLRIFARGLSQASRPDRFMGIVGSGAGKLRIYQSNPANP